MVSEKVLYWGNGIKLHKKIKINSWVFTNLTTANGIEPQKTTVLQDKMPQSTHFEKAANKVGINTKDNVSPA